MLGCCSTVAYMSAWELTGVPVLSKQARLIFPAGVCVWHAGMRCLADAAAPGEWVERYSSVWGGHVVSSGDVAVSVELVAAH